MNRINLIPITDLTAPELFVYADASEKELIHYYEPASGIFIAETANVVLRALDAGYRIESMLVEKERLYIEAAPVFDCVEKLYGKEALAEIPVYIAEHSVVSQLTGYNLVRGLWTVMKRRENEDLSSFCKDKKRIAVLVDVVNPTNVGAIIRSAAALGMDGVILTKNSVDPLTRRATRVSMGTVFQIPWTVADDALDLITFLQKQGFLCAAMALKENSTTPDDAVLRQSDKLAILLGTEGTGLPDEVIASCDKTVMIPMYHGVDSLNVAAASAVIFWALMQK